MSTDKNKKQLNSAQVSYLKLYNFLSAVGWLYVLITLFRTVLTWKNSKDFYTAKNLYANTSFSLKLLLSTAYLEIFHAMFKLVPSNPAIVFPQVFIRWIVVFGVVDNFSVSSESVALIALVFAWSLSEIIRYLYYVFNSNPVLTWLRYSLFIILYPIGAGAEMFCTGYAAKHIYPVHIRSQHSFELPNSLNISLDLFWIFIVWLILYIPGFPFMYLHMFSQRKKVFYSKKKTK